MSYILEHKVDIEDAAWASGMVEVYTVESSLNEECKYPVLLIRYNKQLNLDLFNKYLNKFVPDNNFLVVPVDHEVQGGILLASMGVWLYGGKEHE